MADNKNNRELYAPQVGGVNKPLADWVPVSQRGSGTNLDPCCESDLTKATMPMDDMPEGL
jgi:hypothetical protein